MRACVCLCVVYVISCVYVYVCMCVQCDHTHTERTEKVPFGSIKKVVSEPIKGHEEYHILVSTSAIL